MHFLRFLKIDSNFLVVNSILFMNSLLQVLGDYFLYWLSHDLIGHEGAIITLGFSVVNRRINEIYSKTFTNGVEAIFCVVAMYYYNRLSSKFDRSMIFMTTSITVAFVVRSSSIVGWIPLALSHILQSPAHFQAVVTSGLLITVPVLALSVLNDSIQYGKLTVPQLNFVHVNVVENISQFFGTDPWFYYIQELPEFLSALDGLHTANFGLCMLTVYQLNGRLPSVRFPFILVFIAANLLILSTVEHKEQRFMSSIFPFYALSWAFFWLKMAQLLPFIKKSFKLIFVVYATAEILSTMKNQLNFNVGDKEIYTLLHDRSGEMGEYLSANGFDRIESIYLLSKYESPITTWAHVPEEPKITCLYPPYQQPFFMQLRYFAPFRQMKDLEVRYQVYNKAFT